MKVTFENDAIIQRDDDGQLHSEDGPAIERPDGSMSYWRHGVLHRGNGPAVITPTGARMWLVDGLLHREGGQPAVLEKDGRGEVWENGTFKRLVTP